MRIINNLYLEKHIPEEVIQSSTELIIEDDAETSSSAEKSPKRKSRRQKRFLTLEELCLASNFHPNTVYNYIIENKLEREQERFELAVSWLSYAIGIVFGRFKPGQKGELGSGIDKDGTVLLNADFERLRKLADEDGIMVLDAGHPDDLPSRVEETLAILHGDTESRNLITLLGGDLRRFLEREFFTKWHIPTYKKRPIYWLLQSFKKSYGIYLYHERLTADSIFSIQEKYINPKITYEKNHLAELKEKLTSMTEGREKREREKEIEKREIIIDELIEFQKRIKQVIERGYDPDINDGVILNMAPLHELIPWPEPKKYWKELEEGKYNWAHMAMKYWPERVRDKCERDKSLAIAHGLEE
ncbi:MAG: hypothetical protein ACMUIP_15655 [bacterium]